MKIVILYSWALDIVLKNIDVLIFTHMCSFICLLSIYSLSMLFWNYTFHVEIF